MEHTKRPDINFYTRQSAISSPGKYTAFFDGLPDDIQELCAIIQGIMIHAFWISEDNYGVSLDTLKSQRQLTEEYNLRSVEEMLQALLALDGGSLTENRPANKRLIGNCRDFALFLTAILRHQNVPARVRSGVARYFYKNGQLEDHFITEWWNAEKNRWQYTDPQIDALMKKTCGIELDMTDLPREQFLHAGLGYNELLEGRVTPDKIGIFDFRGLTYVRYKLLSDIACLNKVEVLAWEGWGIVDVIDKLELDTKDQVLLDRIAALLNRYDTDANAFYEIKAIFEEDPRLQFPDNYKPHYMEIPQFS